MNLVGYNVIGAAIRSTSVNPRSLYKDSQDGLMGDRIGKEKKEMPTVGSWYKQIERKSQENKNKDYE